MAMCQFTFEHLTCHCTNLPQDWLDSLCTDSHGSTKWICLSLRREKLSTYFTVPMESKRNKRKWRTINYYFTEIQDEVKPSQLRLTGICSRTFHSGGKKRRWVILSAQDPWADFVRLRHSRSQHRSGCPFHLDIHLEQDKWFSPRCSKVQPRTKLGTASNYQLI